MSTKTLTHVLFQQEHLVIAQCHKKHQHQMELLKLRYFIYVSGLLSWYFSSSPSCRHYSYFLCVALNCSFSTEDQPKEVLFIYHIVMRLKEPQHLSVS